MTHLSSSSRSHAREPHGLASVCTTWMTPPRAVSDRALDCIFIRRASVDVQAASTHARDVARVDCHGGSCAASRLPSRLKCFVMPQRRPPPLPCATVAQSSPQIFLSKTRAINLSQNALPCQRGAESSDAPRTRIDTQAHVAVPQGVETASYPATISASPSRGSGPTLLLHGTTFVCACD